MHSLQPVQVRREELTDVVTLYRALAGWLAMSC